MLSSNIHKIRASWPRPCMATFPRPTRTLSHVLLIVAVLLGMARVCPADERSTRPPNPVLILVDDLGWRDVGFMGSRFYETPAIDRLAREGVVFTDAYVNVTIQPCATRDARTPRIFTTEEHGQEKFHHDTEVTWSPPTHTHTPPPIPPTLSHSTNHPAVVLFNGDG